MSQDEAHELVRNGRTVKIKQYAIGDGYAKGGGKLVSVVLRPTTEPNICKDLLRHGERVGVAYPSSVCNNRGRRGIQGYFVIIGETTFLYSYRIAPRICPSIVFCIVIIGCNSAKTS